MKRDSLKLALVGDISLGFLRKRETAPSGFPEWRAIMDALGPHDLLVGNLECCLVDARCDAHARAQAMAVPSSMASLLRDAGFSALCLANNHMLDCGAAAIAVTRERLSGLGIDTFGAGMDRAEAEAATVLERKGRRIALLGACDSARYYAADGTAGIAPLDRKALGRRVRKAAADADLVVVTLHADLEFSSVPARWRQRLSRWLIEQGAHLVIQHHPHVLQGVETYKGGLVAYSLGNFIFPLRGNGYQENRAGVFDSAVLTVEIQFEATRPVISHAILPLRIADDHFPRPVTTDEREVAVASFERLSRLLGDRDAHRRLWFRRCREEVVKRSYALYYTMARRQFQRGVRDAWRLVAGREERRWLLGFVSMGYL